MALRPQYLADKSALARLQHRAVSDRLVPLVEAGLVATCSIIDLEVLYSARNGADHASIRRDRKLAFPQLDMTQATFDRAIEVQGALAERGQHRGASLPDLLIAAVAEAESVTVLHYDADYELVSSVTGQAVEWVVPAGSVP